MKRLFLFASVLLLNICMLSTAAAQKGNFGIGLRFTPDGAGATGKFFLDRNWVFEAQLNAGGIFGLEGESFNAVGLFEYHVVLPEPSWRLYFGGGAHVGAWDHGGRRWDADDRRWRDDKEAIFGIDGIVGIEYMFKTIPLGLSFDIKPAVNFVTDVNFFPHNMVGLSGRFYF